MAATSRCSRSGTIRTKPVCSATPSLSHIGCFPGTKRLAVDIGGTTIRTGVVALEWQKHSLTEVRMATTKNWRHKDESQGVMPR